MNDRYIFRGKTTSTGDWLEGNLSYNYGDYFIFPIEDAYDSADCYRIDPDTLGQCAGERDKNAKLYFEGDVDERGGVIIWRDGCLGRLHNNEFHAMYELAMYNFEIVGNIHDNPELLETEK